MKNTVIIKGNRYGISIVLDQKAKFPELKEELKRRLENAESFFDSNKQMAVSFEGRSLSNEELDQLLTVIRENSRLNIQYVLDSDRATEDRFRKAVEKTDTEKTADTDTQAAKKEEAGKVGSDDASKPVEQAKPDSPSGSDEPGPAPEHVIPAQPAPKESSDHNGLFYKGTLRSGQSLETKESLVIIGDVNPGAKVIAGGNIVILGALKGSVIAGSNGNHNAFVMALSMDPIQIQIADILARSSDSRPLRKAKKEAMIATIVEEQICIEAVSKSAIQDINF